MGSNVDRIISSLREGNYDGLMEKLRSLPDINAYIKSEQICMRKEIYMYVTLLHLVASMKNAVYLFHLLVTMGANWRLPALDPQGKPRPYGLGDIIVKAGNTELLIQLLQGKIQYGTNVIYLPDIFIGMDSVVFAPVSRGLIDCLASKNLLLEYRRAARRRICHPLIWIWSSYCEGNLSKEDCIYLFGVFKEISLRDKKEYYSLVNVVLFYHAINQWKQSSTFLFDLIEGYPLDNTPWLCLADVYSRAANDVDLLCYLDLCWFLLKRGYAVGPYNISKTMYNKHYNDSVRAKLRDMMSSFSGEFREEIINKLFVVIRLDRLECIDLRSVHCYHLLVDHGRPICNENVRFQELGIIETVKPSQIKQILSYIIGGTLRYCPDDPVAVKIIDQILNPETCTSFPDLFTALSPKRREAMKTMMTLWSSRSLSSETVQKRSSFNILFLLPRELLFLILVNLL
jgi:hypothetical protein